MSELETSREVGNNEIQIICHIRLTKLILKSAPRGKEADFGEGIGILKPTPARHEVMPPLQVRSKAFTRARKCLMLTFADAQGNIFDEYLSSVIAKLPRENE